MSLLGDVVNQYAPSVSDVSGAQAGLKISLAYPGLAQQLADNPNLLSTALTASNIISPSKDTTKDPTGLIIIGIGVFLLGVLVGWIFKKLLKF